MPEYTLPLTERSDVAEGTLACRFETAGTGFTFRAGLYAEFTLIDPPETDAEGNTRAFSIASSPSDKGSIMIATRMRRTAFKNSLRRIPLGTRLRVRGPMGAFTLHKDAGRLAVLLAGGIGITPMRAMIEWAVQERAPRRLLLMYSNRTPGSGAFLADLERWARQWERFRFVATVTGSGAGAWPYERGRIDEAFLRKHVGELRGPMYYAAGPMGMVEGMVGLLAKLGVEEEDTRSEEFPGY